VLLRRCDSQCCVVCFERCIKFLTRHALVRAVSSGTGGALAWWRDVAMVAVGQIDVALFGTSFWSASKSSFGLVMRNIATVFYVDLVSGSRPSAAVRRVAVSSLCRCCWRRRSAKCSSSSASSSSSSSRPSSPTASSRTSTIRRASEALIR
jgi:hypothetical protein